MNIGYARISIEGPSIHSQIVLLERAGCEKIYTDHTFEVNENRLGLIKMLKNIKKGDTVMVYSTDRIFISLQHMVDLINKFNKLDARFKSLSEPVFNTGSNSKLLMQTLNDIIQFKKNLIINYTKEGLNNARKKNIELGRPIGIKKQTLDKCNYVIHLYENIKIPIDEACKKAKLSKTTFYRVEKRLINKIK